MPYFYVTGYTSRGKLVFEGPLEEEVAVSRKSSGKLIQAKVFTSDSRDRGRAAAEFRASKVNNGKSYDDAMERMSSSSKIRTSPTAMNDDLDGELGEESF